MNYARGNLKTEGGNPKSEIRNPKEIRKLKAERTLCEEMSCEGFEFWRWGDEVGTELMALREGAAGKTPARGIGRTHGAVWRGDRSRSLAFGENNDADARILLRISVFGFPSDFGFQISVFETSDFL